MYVVKLAFQTCYHRERKREVEIERGEREREGERERGGERKSERESAHTILFWKKA